jgi:DNA invertase Pin-like site-specific DNA recombinase
MAYSLPHSRATATPLSRYFLYVRKSSEPDDRQVLSIESQKTELLRAYGHLTILETIEEAQSAKAPGRPRFERMMQRLEAGEADGIIAWHPDRLARNSVDGGRIIYDLDKGSLLDLKFAQYTFENTPEGKWMLGIIFGQSKYFVDKLSKDVKRGTNTKLEMGWMPGLAPIGYLNHCDDLTGAHTIVANPLRFPLVRRMWEMMLTGAYSAAGVRVIANDEWGLRSKRRPRSGNKPLAQSSVYRILTNPFYFGHFEYDGQMYKGKHPPMITEEQFWLVQKHLGRQGRHRPQTKKNFAFTGLIRCGECGAMVTAEERHKPGKEGKTYHYTYYHCTKRKTGIRCSQPHIELKELESQIDAVLETITIPEEFVKWALDLLRERHEESSREQRAMAESIDMAVHSVQTQLDALLDIRLRELIGNQEFEEKRQTLLREKAGLEERRGDGSRQAERWFELADRALKFASVARSHFQRGTAEEKRLILETVGSNCILHNKKLHFEPVEPFAYLQNVTKKSSWGSTVEDVRKWCVGADDGSTHIPMLAATSLGESFDASAQAFMSVVSPTPTIGLFIQ